MVGVIVLLLWLVLIPLVVGGITATVVDGRRGSLPFLWITGQLILWAGFQFVCVPLILKEKRFFTDFTKPIDAENPLLSLGTLYLAVAAVLVCLGLIQHLRCLRRNKISYRVISGVSKENGKWYLVLWCVFWVLLLFQMFQAVFMTYGDGDDAFYVAVSTIAEESNTMYQKLPYTGGSTGLDIRHGLAPFPIWIAFLARISGVPTVTVAHVAAPLMLIPMTYGIYYLIGGKVCQKHSEKLPLFLVLTELLVLFGDYSLYSVENFMIARSRQGKAALGSIVIPATIYLFLLILERLQENRKVALRLWLLLLCCIFTGCMCSTLGAVLLCMITGVTGICAAVSYKKWRILIPMALCCVPAVCYAILYVLAE